MRAKAFHAMKRACLATLLFHEGGEWDRERQRVWLAMTGHEEATTRILCETVRAALALAEPDEVAS